MLGRVLGTEGATLLGYWIGVAPGQYFQLDDVVAADREIPAQEATQLAGDGDPRSEFDTNVHGMTLMSS